MYTERRWGGTRGRGRDFFPMNPTGLSSGPKLLSCRSMKLYGLISRTYQGWAGMHVCVSLILFDFANIYNDILRLLPQLCPLLGFYVHSQGSLTKPHA